METFLEILKFTIPALIVGGMSWLLIDRMLANEEQRRMLQIKLKNQDLFTPLRLQAYERLTLFMERITPSQLIQRLNQPGMNAKEFKVLLISEINAEFNHNLSQQIYVSHQVWSVIRAVKEQVVNLVNIAYTKLPPEATAIELSKAIFAIQLEMNEIPNQKALDFLNKEVHLIFTQES